MLCELILVSVPHDFLISRLLPEKGTPTSVAFVATDPNQVVVSFDAGETLLYDLNTGQSVAALETQTKDGTSQSPFVTRSPIGSKQIV